MWKFRASLKLPFWTRENQNKPTKNVFENWIKKNMQEIDNISFNFISFLNATFNSSFDGYKYIEIINSDNENDKRYYFVDSISQTGSANSYKMNCSLDIYSSYTIPFIEANKNKEFIFLRQHNYSKQTLQIDDANFTSIPKIYENFTFEKIPFNNVENTNIWYGENFAIEGSDLLNANKYYVFKDGISGGYKFFPILSKSRNVKIYSTIYEKGEEIYSSTFKNGRYNGGEMWTEISDELNSKIREAYENNNVVVYRRPYYSNRYVFPAHRADFRGYTDIEKIPFGTMPIDIVANSSVYNNAGAGLKTFELTQYVVGNQIAHYKQKNITASWHDYSYNQAKNQALKFEVKIYKGISKRAEKDVKNSIDGLEEYRKKDANINKFLGIFYLPHFLNFSSFDVEEEYVFININPTGDNINFFKIYFYQLSNIDNKLNNNSYSTPYFLRYLNVRYFGNLINAEYRVNSQNIIYIGGKLFFTDTANIISKSDQLIPLDKSIINYPYQLPIGVDTYEQYVKANRNVTDTGFSIQRQNQQRQFAETLFNGGVNFITSGASTVGNAITGDIAGAFNSALKTTTMPFSIMQKIIGSEMALNQEEKRIKAQYQQANMTMGNDIQFSNITTAALMEYYDSENGEQFEGVEVSKLSENSLIQMNNYIYLNGYLNPNKSTFNKKLDFSKRTFNFIQIENQIITATINIKYNSNYNNEIYNLILEQLTNGVRIWNSENIDDLEEWDENAEWPDQPNPDNLISPKPPLRVPKTMKIKPEIKINSGTFLWLRAIGHNGFITFYNDTLSIRMVNSYSQTSIEGRDFIKEQTLNFKIPSDITELIIDLSKIDNFAVYSSSFPSNGWVATDISSSPLDTINFVFKNFKNPDALSFFKNIKGAFQNRDKFTTSNTTNVLNLTNVNIIEKVGDDDNRTKN